MTHYWIGVASADHVRRGVREGFMQVNHGKHDPLKRIRPGDFIAYYSPNTTMGTKDGLQSFTACGVVKEGEPYQGAMASGFQPFRRDVAWSATGAAKITPMLQALSFTAGRTSWGQPFRYGLFSINENDYQLIEAALFAAGGG